MVPRSDLAQVWGRLQSMLNVGQGVSCVLIRVNGELDSSCRCGSDLCVKRDRIENVLDG